MGNESPAIVAKDLTKRFESFTAVDSVSFEPVALATPKSITLGTGLPS